jgi:Rrf2 family protein
MHIPIKVDYGVRALVELGLSASEEPMRAVDIARRTNIPEQFLAQVLLTLARAGMVKSQRGPNGGHILAMDPDDIKLSMIMAQLGAGDTLVGCLDDIGSCVQYRSCAQRDIWASVADAVFQILDSTTVGELVRRTRATEAANLDKGREQAVEISVA